MIYIVYFVFIFSYIYILMKKWYKLCPKCWGEIKKEAIKCLHCHEFLNTKIECPYCFGEIEPDTEKCPFCNELLKEKKVVWIINKFVNFCKSNLFLKRTIFISSSLFLLNIVVYFFDAIWYFLTLDIDLKTSLVSIPWDLFSTYQFVRYYKGFLSVWLAYLIAFIVFWLIVYGLRKYWFNICICLIPFSIISTFCFIIWLIKFIFFQ